VISKIKHITPDLHMIVLNTNRLNVVITVLRDEKKIKEKILHNMQEKNSRSLAVKSQETLFNFLPMAQGLSD